MLTDCEKCWETPCGCGWQYRNWSEEKIIDFIDNLLKYHDRDKILKRLGKDSLKQKIQEFKQQTGYDKLTPKDFEEQGKILKENLDMYTSKKDSEKRWGKYREIKNIEIRDNKIKTIFCCNIINVTTIN
jgi:KaiC/GvpD/RAD55 family RecA-like ATPase